MQRRSAAEELGPVDSYLATLRASSGLSAEGATPLYRPPALESHAEFRKFRKHFAHSGDRRANALGGVVLHTALYDRRVRDEDDAVQDVGTIQQNILHQSVMSALRKQTGRTARELRFITDWMRSIDFLASLEQPVRAALQPALELLFVDAKSSIFEHGAAADRFYIVFKGQCQKWEPGAAKPKQKHVTGDIFGQQALFSEAARGYSVRAMATELQLVAVRKGAFLAALATDGSFAAESARKRSVMLELPLFQAMDEAVLEEVSMFFVFKTYCQGEIIGRQGDDCGTLFLLVGGTCEHRIELELIVRDGAVTSAPHSVGVSAVHPGHFFGASFLPDVNVWQHSVVATSDVELLCVNMADFESTLEDHASLLPAIATLRETTALQAQRMRWRVEELKKTLISCSAAAGTEQQLEAVVCSDTSNPESCCECTAKAIAEVQRKGRHRSGGGESNRRPSHDSTHSLAASAKGKPALQQHENHEAATLDRARAGVSATIAGSYRATSGVRDADCNAWSSNLRRLDASAAEETATGNRAWSGREPLSYDVSDRIARGFNIYDMGSQHRKFFATQMGKASASAHSDRDDISLTVSAKSSAGSVWARETQAAETTERLNRVLLRAGQARITPRDSVHVADAATGIPLIRAADSLSAAMAIGTPRVRTTGESGRPSDRVQRY